EPVLSGATAWSASVNRLPAPYVNRVWHALCPVNGGSDDLPMADACRAVLVRPRVRPAHQLRRVRLLTARGPAARAPLLPRRPPARRPTDIPHHHIRSGNRAAHPARR